MSLFLLNNLENALFCFCFILITTQIKLSSVQLAKKYMKRVAYELDSVSGSDKDPNREFLLLQGVRFAFRVHQVKQNKTTRSLNDQISQLFGYISENVCLVMYSLLEGLMQRA